MLDGGATSRLATTRFGDVRWLPSVDSTNRHLLQEARAGAPEGTVVVADHQASGRGRLDRAWVAPPGSSLLVSVLLRPDLPLERLHLLTAVVALAAADACESEAGVEAGLKWPNDLVVGSRKLGGILAETLLEGSRAGAVVVGLGLNVNWGPELDASELAAEAVSLDHLAGGEVDRAALLVALLSGLEDRYRALSSRGGQLAQAGEYRRRCTTVGRVVRVELADETFTGSVADVSDEGHLLVDVGMCLRTVTAGDVVHVR
ncbi:MAG TPA: biotin--[acetyl-CoA-carboxylase] ligase [Acidimicrobiales bacterium]|nr:biotin--[acetyl-CoA-carboxylase] ligase [Acidimicrobiales bacterium]